MLNIYEIENLCAEKGLLSVFDDIRDLIKKHNPNWNEEYIFEELFDEAKKYRDVDLRSQTTRFILIILLRKALFEGDKDE